VRGWEVDRVILTNASEIGIDTGPELTPQLLRRAADRGTAYLLRNLRGNGKFVYQRNALSGRPVPGQQYNLLRHFGSLWAILEDRGDDPDVRRKVQRGVGWALERYYVRTRRGGAFRKGDWVATGCSGLALLALNGLRQPRPSGLDDLSAELIDYLLAVRIEDPTDDAHLDFQHKIALAGPVVGGVVDDVTTAPEISPFRSNFYTGEILFGLIAQLGALRSARDPRADRITAAVTGSMAALQARDHGVAHASHWMMYAIRHYCATEQRFTPELVTWAGRIATSVLAMRNRRSAPTACRIDGQIQFLDLLDDCPELAALPAIVTLRTAVLRQVHADCALLLQLQDRETGGFIGSATDPIMQIDFTQHAISALRGVAPRLG
jgi:hypothetical protein